MSLSTAIFIDYVYNILKILSVDFCGGNSVSYNSKEIFKQKKLERGRYRYGVNTADEKTTDNDRA